MIIDVKEGSRPGREQARLQCPASDVNVELGQCGEGN